MTRVSGVGGPAQLSRWKLQCIFARSGIKTIRSFSSPRSLSCAFLSVCTLVRNLVYTLKTSKESPD